LGDLNRTKNKKTVFRVKAVPPSTKNNPVEAHRKAKEWPVGKGR
jgi:hypothetical protein